MNTVEDVRQNSIMIRLLYIHFPAIIFLMPLPGCAKSIWENRWRCACLQWEIRRCLTV